MDLGPEPLGPGQSLETTDTACESSLLFGAYLSTGEMIGCARVVKRFVPATADAHGLYGEFGFEPLEKPERWLINSGSVV